MRRGGEDELLAISPPPEFQDNPALPPPVLFQDLSPSPNADTRKSSLILSQAVQKCIKEFADKVSYNILNEAMIIATLIPSSGINDVRSQASTPSFPISSGDSYSSDTLSTGTSWEYLEKSNSVADLRCLRTSYWIPNPGESSRRKSGQLECNYRSRLKKSNSDALSSHPVSGMSSGNKEIFDSSHLRAKTVVVRKKILTKAQNRSSCESFAKKNLELNDSTDDVDVCYNVPFQCDIYSLPIDSISPQEATKPTTRRSLKNLSKRGGNNSGNENSQVKILDEENLHRGAAHRNKEKQRFHPSRKGKPAAEELGKKINPGSRLSERNNNENATGDKMRWSKKRRSRSVDIDNQNTLNQRKIVQSSEAQSSQLGEFSSSKGKRNFGHTLLNLFRRNRQKSKTVQLPNNNDPKLDIDREVGLVSRALPPPPPPDSVENPMADNKSPVEPRDFAASIEKVKDCGWYWGPLASDEAEDLLRGEPDGSFIVRDSSDAHYIFSLTFKLNGLVRHVRIEHDQGNFSFGPLTRFKAATIVEFVEKAVAHSRSGRYLFFLHRRPVLGPMQVQLLHPYSRFRHPRSLQHMCRFVILKSVRRDLLNTLPLPKPLQDYLNTPHYYFEQQELSSKNT